MKLLAQKFKKLNTMFLSYITLEINSKSNDSIYGSILKHVRVN